MARWIVAGPPCSGKSAFVKDRAGAGDLIYDYDALMGAMTGQSLHEHEERIRLYVLAARDAIVEALAKNPDQGAWIITATHKAGELRELRQALGAGVILLMVDPEEAHRRCTEAGRPAAWHEYIDRWYRRSDIDPAEFPMPDLAKGKRSMETKTYTAGLELKAAGSGEFEAIFATLGTPDLDGDIATQSSFKAGQVVIVEPWNHDYGSLPVGKGQIRTDDTTARIAGRFFMDTPAGKAHHTVLRELREIVEFSYTFRILDAGPGTFEGQKVRFLRSLDVCGIAPVTRGAAGPGRSGLVSIKTAASAGGGLHLLALGPRNPAAALRQVEALADPKTLGHMAETELVDLELTHIEGRLQRSGTHPTNRDLLADRIRAGYTDADGQPSEAWVGAMVAGELAGRAAQLATRRGGVNEQIVEREAAAAVESWARSPARR